MQDITKYFGKLEKS